MRVLLLPVLAIAAALPAAGPALAATPCPEVSDAPALIEQLKTGGYILLFRHADRYSVNATPKAPADLGRELPEGCAQPLQALTPAGIAQAKAIGMALAGVPIDGVFATSACRTIETADLAFGRSEPLAPSLGDAIASPPPPGKNTVIVSHREKIVPALKDIGVVSKDPPACGEAAVIDPTGTNGHPECIARVLPRQWDPANGKDALPWENKGECSPR